MSSFDPFIVLRDDSSYPSTDNEYPQSPVSESGAPCCQVPTSLPSMTSSPGTGGEASPASIPPDGMHLTPHQAPGNPMGGGSENAPGAVILT